MDLAGEMVIRRGRDKFRNGDRDLEEVETEARDLKAVDVKVLAVVSICLSPPESRGKSQALAAIVRKIIENYDLQPCKPSLFSSASDLWPPRDGFFDDRYIFIFSVSHGFLGWIYKF
ncbi:hypothetical protein TIFTF001_025301 [Ficus carica]|uniref:Uncharacterized protein n=1 Tax=Ficus carica TaxID=3494 RepID=A0AA88AWL9_FICCA|nr:hypothetical protein TIFTF001_025301 [Ficus carica]